MTIPPWKSCRKHGGSSPSFTFTRCSFAKQDGRDRFGLLICECRPCQMKRAELSWSKLSSSEMPFEMYTEARHKTTNTFLLRLGKMWKRLRYAVYEDIKNIFKYYDPISHRLTHLNSPVALRQYVQRMAYVMSSCS